MMQVQDSKAVVAAAALHLSLRVAQDLRQYYR